MRPPFTEEERDRVRDRVLELARSDERIVAAAVVGSLALGGGDEWSDLDLTFGVADGVPVAAVVDQWTRVLEEELEAVQLFDLPVGTTVYRVFLLPSALQVDLSFAPASDFHEGSPRFRLLYGTAKKSYPEPPDPANLFGWAVVYALHARASIVRAKPWQVAYDVGAVRDNALMLACRKLGLPTRFGKGYDALPPEVLAAAEEALVRSLEVDELRRALAAAVELLLREAAEAGDVVARVEPQLRELTS